LRFAELDEWGLRDSVLHRRDPRAKIVALLLVLIAVSRGSLIFPAAAVVTAIVLARLPMLGVLLRATVVLPFSLSFALASLLSGKPQVAAYVLLRSYLSAACVVTFLGCTPLPASLDGLRRMGAPSLLLEVIQFVYRYLTLIAEQSKRMSIAASARGARRSIAAVAGSIGVLFARSYDRAEAVNRAMLARGYTGTLTPRAPHAFKIEDALTLLAGAAVLAASVLWRP
jgi:cobalt/nickel transport system permease protein